MASRFGTDAVMEPNEDVASAKDVNTFIARLQTKITNTLLSVQRAGLSVSNRKMHSALPEPSAPQRASTRDMQAAMSPSKKAPDARRSL